MHVQKLGKETQSHISCHCMFANERKVRKFKVARQEEPNQWVSFGLFLFCRLCRSNRDCRTRVDELRQRRKDGSPADILQNYARKDIKIDRYKNHLHQSTLVKERVPQRIKRGANEKDVWLNRSMLVLPIRIRKGMLILLPSATDWILVVT